MNFGSNLMLLRKQKGFSQESLAFEIGVSRQTVYSWECGTNYPNILLLKKLADTLSVSCDDLIAGIDISKFPSTLGEFGFIYKGKYNGEIIYDEVPNWFIKLKTGEEVNFALYDNGKKDYSYHLTVSNEIKLHDKNGFEIVVDEYEETGNKTALYSLIARKENNRISFIGRIFSENGKRIVETYKDEEFLKDWGYGINNIGSETLFANAENYLIEYADKSIKTIKIGYMENDSCFEVYLNDSFESLLWMRYDLGIKSNQKVIKDGKTYGLNYVCVTDRLIKKLIV